MKNKHRMIIVHHPINKVSVHIEESAYCHPLQIYNYWEELEDRNNKNFIDLKADYQSLKRELFRKDELLKNRLKGIRYWQRRANHEKAE